MPRRGCGCCGTTYNLATCCAGDVGWALAVFEETRITSLNLSGLGPSGNYSFTQTGVSSHVTDQCQWNVVGDLNDGSTTTEATASVTFATGGGGTQSRWGAFVPGPSSNNSGIGVWIDEPGPYNGTHNLDQVGGVTGSLTVNPLGRCLYCCGDCWFETIENAVFDDNFSAPYVQNGNASRTGDQCTFIMPMRQVSTGLTGSLSLDYDPALDEWGCFLSIGGPPVIRSSGTIGESTCTYSVAFNDGTNDWSWDVVGQACEEVIPFDEGVGAMNARRKVRVRASSMSRALNKALPGAFNKSCCSCQDIFRLLNSYTPERAEKNIDRLAESLLRATSKPGRPGHIAAMTIDDCRSILSRIITESNNG